MYGPSNLVIYYCDSNIGLFSIAPDIDTALPTIATAIVVSLNLSSSLSPLKARQIDKYHLQVLRQLEER